MGRGLTKRPQKPSSRTRAKYLACNAEFIEHLHEKYSAVRERNSMYRQAKHNAMKMDCFGEVRTLTENGKRYYVLNDICNTLGVGMQDAFAVCQAPKEFVLAEGLSAVRTYRRTFVRADDVRNVYGVALGQGRFAEVEGLEYVLQIRRKGKHLGGNENVRTQCC